MGIQRGASATVNAEYDKTVDEDKKEMSGGASLSYKFDLTKANLTEQNATITDTVAKSMINKIKEKQEERR